MAFFKIIYGGIFELYQGKKALELFKGIYTQYVHAETGRTAGIEMSERKSKQILSHVGFAWKIALAQLLIVFVGCIVLKTELDNVATTFINGIYMNETSNLNHTKSVSEITLGHSLDLYNAIYGSEDEATYKINYPDASVPEE